MPSHARVAKQTKGHQEDLVVAFFARALTEKFDSKIANGGPLFFRQLSRHCRFPIVDPSHLERTLRVVRVSMPVQVTRKTAANSTERTVPSTLLLGTFWLLWLSLVCDFSHLKGEWQGIIQRWGMACILPQVRQLHQSAYPLVCLRHASATLGSNPFQPKYVPARMKLEAQALSSTMMVNR
jgi:hypothetical protein